MATKTIDGQAQVASALTKVADKLAPIAERYAPTIVKSATGNAPPV